jgi:hypothetical protein
MASERPGVSACFEAHRSIFTMNSSDNRIARTGLFPVAGRPGFRFGITLFDRFMNLKSAEFSVLFCIFRLPDKVSRRCEGNPSFQGMGVV